MAPQTDFTLFQRESARADELSEVDNEHPRSVWISDGA